MSVAAFQEAIQGLISEQRQTLNLSTDASCFVIATPPYVAVACLTALLPGYTARKYAQNQSPTDGCHFPVAVSLHRQAQMIRRTFFVVSGVAFIVATSDFGIAVSRLNVATPNARVADAFSAMPLNVTTVLTNVRAALPTPIIEAKFDTRSSVDAIVAVEFSAVAPDAVMSSDETSSLRQGLMLKARASLEAALPENEATPRQDSLPAASPNPNEGELPYLKYYVYSESPPPEKPAKTALAALRGVPLGTPVQEIERAAEAFGIDVNFMKAVAKVESDFNPRERTGSYIGLFQLSKSEFSQFGSGEILNPRDNAMGAAYKFVTEAALFEALTHKKPTFSDLYLIHQQGWEGAAEHVSHPQQIAWKSMCATREGLAKGERWCKRAIWGNTLPAVKREWKSVDHITSGAFVAMWRDRIDTLYARYGLETVARPPLVGG
jgi:hypothetical protein